MEARRKVRRGRGGARAVKSTEDLFTFRFVSVDQIPRMVSELSARFAAIEARLDALEALFSDADSCAAKAKRSDAIESTKGGAKESDQPLSIPSTSASPVSATQARLDAELRGLGFPPHLLAFTRVPSDYYDRPLEYRRSCLGAASLDRLCKTLLLTNTRAKKMKLSDEEDKGLTSKQRAALSEHFLVVVQYESAKFDAERLKRVLCERAAGAAPAKGFNLRLAADGAAEELTGYSHGAVTPVGARCGLLGSRGQVVVAGEGGEGTEVPVILSSRIARLPEFWMGAGEVDLKLCVSTREFVDKYDPVVADVMHGDGEGGGDEG